MLDVDEGFANGGGQALRLGSRLRRPRWIVRNKLHLAAVDGEWISHRGSLHQANIAGEACGDMDQAAL